MKTLYFDCSMGAAGDMLTAALLELIPDAEQFIEELNALGIPDVCIVKETAVKCGIKGTHVHVTINGEEEESHDVHNEHEHHHEHHHDHDGHHEHEHHHEHHDHDGQHYHEHHNKNDHHDH